LCKPVKCAATPAREPTAWKHAPSQRERVAKFNVEEIKPQDLVGSAGPPDDEI